MKQMLMLLGCTGACFLGAAPAQEKKKDVKDVPRVIVAMPLGIAAGVKTKVTLRGLKLDTATEVRFFEPKVQAKIVKMAKVPVPNQQDPKRIGDSLVEVEIQLPPDLMQSDLSFLIVTPAGESAAHKLLVNGEGVPVAEKEPNNGFRQAQPIQAGQVIEGLIQQGQDVDVFRLAGKQGKRLVFEVLADRLGSPLDSLLTLYDADGRILATSDDHGDSRDARLETTIPRAGSYHLSLADAHDQGGPAFVYRLLVQHAKVD